MLGPSDTEACLVAAGSLGVTTSQYVIISLNGSTEKNNISWRRISVAAPVFILNPESDAEELPLAEDLVYVSTRTVVSNFLFDVVKTTDYSTFATNDTTNNTWSTTMMVSEGSTRRPWRSKANSSASRRLADNDLDHQGTSLSLFLPDGSTQLFAIVDPTQNETLLLLVSQESWAALWPNNEFPPIHAVWHNIDSSTIVAADYSFLAPVIVLLVLATVGAAYVLYDRRYLKEQNFMQEQENSSFVDDDLTKWQIRADELKELPKSVRSRSFVSSFSVNSASKTAKGSQTDVVEVELYYGRKVWVKRRELAYYFIPETYHVEFLQKLKRLHHANFTHLFGVVLSTDPSVFEMKMVTEYCPKQSIYDLITQEHFDFTFALKAILIRDIVIAMTFLHSSFLNCHGSLKSPNCLVSDRFTVKISDYGLHMFPIYPPAISQDESLYHMLLWTAPEILRGAIIRLRKGSKEGDVYSFAIIVQEILTLTEPFYHPNSFLTPKDIVKRLIDRSTVPFRPPVPYDTIPPQLRALITSAWDEEPTQRPTFKVIGQKLSKMTDELPKNASYLAYVIEKMEQYSDQLEFRVAKASEGLIEEKKKSDELLAQMMPKTVLDRLRIGQIVEPEAFQQVTIGFTAVIDFAQFAFHSTPIEIVHFLNGLYTVFDDIIEHFDIYKVETIQDSYMVASGLPTRNGHDHVRQVGSMALQMMKSVEKVHMPGGGATNMKIGLHTGGCAAGVIGVKAPRYCLFGDTINTASRMCTVGEGHKVVISDGMKTYLDMHFPDEFLVDFRNDTEVKGKGKMKTYYLREKPGHSHVLGTSHRQT
ncbi:hypothetical protein RvY_03548-2 [Ramazzottius varieornatus]|uniref:Guanylate cyclase n=1 Tax=Ramazzottius varieornatus TaxID=947166 RepID=A0A1D1UYL5_RAMVA|nr:hypothetical protein RvY_03548-2 [Ramazzottius varieornatus]